MAILEYIWLDGYAHNSEHPDDVANIRSKIKIVNNFIGNIEDLPLWSFDGSSTMQAKGHKSDCILQPVNYVKHPLLRENNQDSYIVLCEVLNADRTPHSSNTRALLREVYGRNIQHEMWFALEQEYAIYDKYGENPYMWPSQGFPAPQGRYYCGVGSDVAWGRKISENHLLACLRSNLQVGGTNAEVMPSQWEFQIGPLDALQASDQLWIARFILNRLAEDYEATIKLDPKPVKGDWNGTGCHINFSTKSMREHLDLARVTEICGALEKNISKHLSVYGKCNHERLTGKHETCSINQFRFGEADRGASIRIPPGVLQAGKGYLEDRRPAANVDPYEACRVLMETVCGC
jgi:glutamine synthetase